MSENPSELNPVGTEPAAPEESVVSEANEGQIYVARSGAHWVLRLHGVIRFTLSPALNQLLDQAFADPQTEQILLDLSHTRSIDSTNLGVLARIARFARQRGAPPPPLIAPDPSIIALLEGICFDQLFTILPSADYSAAGLTQLSALDTDERAMMALVLEAHRRLCAIDAKNHAEFRDLVAALEQQTPHGD